MANVVTITTNDIVPLRDLRKRKKFWVEYNGKYIAEYKSVRACIIFIGRKGLLNDCDNVLDIVDNNGDFYDVITGEKIID